MRLPLSKIYRAFPELDRFEDARCESFVHGAKRQHWASGLVIAFLFVPALFVSVIVASVITMLVFERALDFAATKGINESAIVAAGSLLGIAVAAVPPVFVLRARDRWLRWAIARHINHARCFCGYSLLGLTIEDGAVQCPECGERIVLADRGLTPDMLLAGELEEATGNA